MILQMTRASPLSFAEFAILSPMSKTDAHSLDPIPDEQFLETHDAAEGKPAGVRFLAFNTVIDIEAYGEKMCIRDRPTSDPIRPLMAPPRAEPTINAIRVRAGSVSYTHLG